MVNTILVVEDEKRLRDIIKDFFEDEGYKILSAENGKIGLELFETNKVDLVILDIMMPELDGWSVCRRIRKESKVPIIFLTARSEEDDKLMGYEIGADDYVTKPFSPKVLVAKSKNLLKRVEGNIGNDDGIIEIDELIIDRSKAHAIYKDEIIELAPKEFELLWYLMVNSKTVLTRDNILDNVWGYDYFGEFRVVDTHIKKLRKKLGEASKYVKTVVKFGYKFDSDD
ncbi:MAG: response regulator transcription factor [Clostridia bacterium]|nr:response regulator transcription factor [Clostridia bacterium]